MELEHAFTLRFRTPNYGVETCPQDEWNVTVKGDLSKADMNHGRQRPDIDTLLQCEDSRLAKLLRCEVISVVLYTGPMVRLTPYFILSTFQAEQRRYSKQESFVAYCWRNHLSVWQYYLHNAILRQSDKYPELKALGRVFTTTIHVLVSAVLKLSRAMKLPEGLRLYRGLGGTMDLPEAFFHADECGRRGFTEWGFMSTTADKAIEIQYSGVMEGRPLPMVLEVAVRERVDT
jgi:hypothetical protein